MSFEERFNSNEDVWECDKHPGEQESSFEVCPKCDDEYWWEEYGCAEFAIKKSALRNTIKWFAAKEKMYSGKDIADLLERTFFRDEVEFVGKSTPQGDEE